MVKKRIPLINWRTQQNTIPRYTGAEQEHSFFEESYFSKEAGHVRTEGRIGDGRGERVLQHVLVSTYMMYVGMNE